MFVFFQGEAAAARKLAETERGALLRKLGDADSREAQMSAQIRSLEQELHDSALEVRRHH